MHLLSYLIIKFKRRYMHTLRVSKILGISLKSAVRCMYAMLS